MSASARIVSLALLSLFVVMNNAAADSPPPAPQDVKVLSPNGRFFALSRVKQKNTAIYSTADKHHPQWELPAYFPVLFLSDDGRHLVGGYHGGNILSPDARPTDPFLSFYVPSQLVHEMRVRDLFPDVKALPETASGRAWGNFYGFDRRNNFVLLLSDGSRLVFDANTGKVIQRTRSPE